MTAWPPPTARPPGWTRWASTANWPWTRCPVSGQQTTDPRDPAADGHRLGRGGHAPGRPGRRPTTGPISVDVDGNPLPILGAEAKQAGRATGLVTTAQVTDATPAAFFSATADRAAQDDIARQYLEVTKPDVILGGGEDWWLPAGTPGAYPDTPADDPEPRAAGARRATWSPQAEELGLRVRHATPTSSPPADGDQLLGLFANQEMFQQRPEGQGDDYAPVVPLADHDRARPWTSSPATRTASSSSSRRRRSTR